MDQQTFDGTAFKPILDSFIGHLADGFSLIEREDIRVVTLRINKKHLEEIKACKGYERVSKNVWGADRNL